MKRERLSEFIELIEGDCLEVLPTLAPGEFDAVVTDPPYGTTANKWDVTFSFPDWWRGIHRACSAAVVMTASQPFTAKVVVSNIDNFKHEWIWIKNRGSNFANTVREPFKEHESVVVFSAGKWTYNPQTQERTGTGLARVQTPVKLHSNSENYRPMRCEVKSLPDARVPSSWQKFNTEVGLHPTQKPAELFRYLILTYTNSGDSILDPFAGSGTTGIAAAMEGRHCLLIEKDAKYCDVIRRRVEAYECRQPGSLLLPPVDSDLFAGVPA